MGGDRRAREDLFRRQLPVIYSAVARLVPAERVDDVVQETATRAIEHLDELRDTSRLRSWLLTIALHEARRDRAARSVAPDWRLPEPGPDIDPQDVAVARVTMSGQRRELAAATAWLDPDDRELLTLWWLETLGEMDRPAVASTLEQEAAYVAVRLQRLRERLMKARVLVRVLAGTDSCPELAAESSGWDGEPSALWRKRFLRHVSSCGRCGAAGGALIPPERLLPAFPLLVPAPAFAAVSSAAAGAPAKAAGTQVKTVVRAVRRLQSLGGNTAAAVVATVAVAAASIGVYAVRAHRPDPAPAAAVEPAAPGSPAGRAPSAAPASSAPAPARASVTPIVYAGPLEITKGGTYRGNWASTNPDVAAVTIHTSEPVIIEQCHVRGPGTLIGAWSTDRATQISMNVTVRNCTGEGLDPGLTGRARGFFFKAVWPHRVVITNNEFRHTRGIHITGDRKPGSMDELLISRNRAFDTDGRVTRGRCDPQHNPDPRTTKQGSCAGFFSATLGIIEPRHFEISWNEIVNQPGQSDYSDIISVTGVAGTPARPALITDNYLRGAYAKDPTLSNNGSMITCGDSSPGNTAEHASRYLTCRGNHCVSFSNICIAIAEGHHNLITGNRMISTGRLPDGRVINSHYTGFYIRNLYHETFFTANAATGNTTAVTYISPTGKPVPLAPVLTDCAPNACHDNTTQTPTTTTENNEHQRWQQQAHTTGITTGPTS
ncbi:MULTISPECIES: sigma-70 family RNA polymerase sigma factor [unclassified Actinoplanes]|uniref:sigma-70 family RNA polymerase sigma factor n=1 Tax=unclassified Actinoplanes TaxID=2626549 RepID=UPI0002DD6486|nr:MULTISPECIES: sigma-70 family RNA polymerase sigma factor [unclassified Actinoplanes]